MSTGTWASKAPNPPICAKPKCIYTRWFLHLPPFTLKGWSMGKMGNSPKQNKQRTVCVCVQMCLKCLLTASSSHSKLSHSHSGSIRLRVGFPPQVLNEPDPHKQKLQPTLMEAKPQITNSVWSQLTPNLRALSLSRLPESIQPSMATFTCEGVNDSGQEIPHFTLIKFPFQNPHAWLSINKSRVPMFDLAAHWWNQCRECSNAA